MKPINWPTPFYYEFREKVDDFDSEPCVVLFNDGRELQGKLTRFSPENGTLVVMSANGDYHKPQFELINQLRLLYPVNLRKKAGLIEESPAVIFGHSERQSCQVLFTNDTKLEGETIGFVTDKSGLYLYLAGESGSVTRYFMPAQAVKSYHIGETIGQMLVKEHIVTQQEIDSSLEKQEKLRSMRIGEYLTNEQIVTPEQLVAALERQSKSNLKLGDVLIQERLITPDDLKAALTRQGLDKKIPLGEIIVKMGIVDEDTIKRMLVKKLGIPFVNIKNYTIDANAVLLVPVSVASKYSIMPLLCKDKTLIVATDNPMNWESLNELRFLTNLNVVPVMASLDDILLAIKRFYTTTASSLLIDDLASDLISPVIEEETPEENIAESDNTLVRLVNKVIIDAYNQGVSDIHIETYPGKHNTHVRFRIDGSLSKYFEFPPNFRSALISRIKIMANLDISEKRKPQDGKIEFRLRGEEKIELRVATVPTTNGLENIVMRILAAAKPIPIEKIGLPGDVLARVEVLVKKPYGLFLICGPTGSGKTTTLHSILGSINTPDCKIWTAEDPIEITQEGLCQVQVNARIGWTFAAAMRSFLRADPDVIMVGEMRDIETAKIAIEASLTGHMVFSTLHTNSAPESMVRLLDLGMDPFNFADALVGILAQRLSRRHCAQCKKSYLAADEEIHDLAREYCLNTPLDPDAIYQHWKSAYADENGAFTLSSANGCTECGGSGYKGRIGLYEFLEATPAIKKLVQKQATVEELLFAAIAQGMHTLKQDGIEKIMQGQTDINQIRAVCS
ncbi:MAG: ATPase, T2SS/T4P/T4SS family [Gallionella sp.]|nr:ATPase, T2SS/T4P/T4SS family [Gallionella sp.]